MPCSGFYILNFYIFTFSRLNIYILFCSHKCHCPFPLGGLYKGKVKVVTQLWLHDCEFLIFVEFLCRFSFITEKKYTLKLFQPLHSIGCSIKFPPALPTPKSPSWHLLTSSSNLHLCLYLLPTGHPLILVHFFPFFFVKTLDTGIP